MRSAAARRLSVVLVVSTLVLGIASTPVAALEGAAAPPASASAAARSEPPFRIDAQKSQFFVEAEAAGVLAAFAHDHKFQVRAFSGTVSVPSKGLPSASLDISIVADSLMLVDKVSDGDRKEIEGKMKNELLETAKFPTVTFRSVGVTVESSSDASSRLGVLGNLWLHGVGHKITIPMSVALKGDSVRATGTFKMRQTDYGMTPVTAAVGTIRVKDEVTISFDIVATRP